ncbi:site-2 protease family protein [Nonomuraea sp. NPDC050680]|uniref:site-2 protease family protein n=1 Tax=Nonomuraea sp. NPDC050680 TaxID=3154630 RepID=UPI0034104164
MRPGDEHRVFYRKKWWQKVIIMSGGPLTNFVPAFIFFMILLVGIGLPAEVAIVSPTTETCVIPSLIRSHGPGPVRLGITTHRSWFAPRGRSSAPE